MISCNIFTRWCNWRWSTIPLEFSLHFQRWYISITFTGIYLHVIITGIVMSMWGINQTGIQSMGSQSGYWAPHPESNQEPTCGLSTRNNSRDSIHRKYTFALHNTYWPTILINMYICIAQKFVINAIFYTSWKQSTSHLHFKYTFSPPWDCINFHVKIIDRMIEIPSNHI